jgi:hypothetical protein
MRTDNENAAVSVWSTPEMAITGLEKKKKITK